MSDTTVKLMSITRGEFELSLAGFDASARLNGEGTAVIALPGGNACIRFEELPKRRLGGLIHMPQARVTIDLAGVPAAERAEFLRRFEIAFQRGGG